MRGVYEGPPWKQRNPRARNAWVPKPQRARYTGSTGLKPLNPGQTHNIGSSDHLLQVQHKGGHVEIVDHFDHPKGSPEAVDAHVVHIVDQFGRVIEKD